MIGLVNPSTKKIVQLDNCLVEPSSDYYLVHL